MKNIPSAVGSALQNKDEELHFLFYSLLNQNDPQEMVVVQALLNPGNCPMIVFKDKYPTHISIPPQLLGMTHNPEYVTHLSLISTALDEI